MNEGNGLLVEFNAERPDVDPTLTAHSQLLFISFLLES